MKMKKKFYYAPMAKFHKLNFRASMLQASAGQDENDAELAKGCTLFFDEDED